MWGALGPGLLGLMVRMALNDEGFDVALWSIYSCSCDNILERIGGFIVKS